MESPSKLSSVMGAATDSPRNPRRLRGFDGAHEYSIPKDVICNEMRCDGECLWEIFSAKITLNESLSESDEEVRIHGAMVMFSNDDKGYLFRRSKDDAQVFKASSGETLALNLQSPVKPCVFSCSALTMFCGLKLNDKSIFPIEGDVKIPGIRNYTEDADLFGEGSGAVGTGWLMLRLGGDWDMLDEFYQESFTFPKPCLPIVSSLDVDFGVIEKGVVAQLKFTVVSHDLNDKLFGVIIASSGHWSEPKWLNLFDKMPKEALPLKSGDVIPLSRSAISVACGSPLRIIAELFTFDENHYDEFNPFLIVETEFSAVYCTSASQKRSMGGGLIEVELTPWC